MLQNFHFLNAQGLTAILMAALLLLVLFKLIKFMFSGVKGIFFALSLAAILFDFASGKFH